MAGGYVGEEEDFWKCPKHPSRRPRTGVCHVCLKERLSSLCPECANPRPCHRCFSSSSSSRAEPPLRRSRSVAVSSFRSKPDQDRAKMIWWMFKNGSGSESKRIDPENSGVNADVSYTDRVNKNSNNIKGKGGGWHFLSPMKVLKRSVSRSSLVHERSPLRC